MKKRILNVHLLRDAVLHTDLWEKAVWCGNVGSWI